MFGSLRGGSWAACGNLALKELLAEICLLLARNGTLEGESCVLGPCPFLSRQRRTFTTTSRAGLRLVEGLSEGSGPDSNVLVLICLTVRQALGLGIW